jgi:hypothetical protein
MTSSDDNIPPKPDWATFIGQAKQSLQSRLEQELDHIEAALNAGRTYNEVLAHLNANGFEIKKGAFPNMLYRARVRRQTRDVKHRQVAIAQRDAPTEVQQPPRPPVKRPDPSKKLVWDPNKEPNW